MASAPYNMNTSLLFSEKQIQERLKSLTQQINSFFGQKELVAVGILKGAFVFYAELLKHLKQDIVCDFCCVSFYGAGRKAVLEAQLSLDTQSPVHGKHVLLIDGIADHGHSLRFIKNLLLEKGAACVKTAVLAAKPRALKSGIVDFKAFEVSQESFVIGWGLDYNQKGRSLRELVQLNELN